MKNIKTRDELYETLTGALPPDVGYPRMSGSKGSMEGALYCFPVGLTDKGSDDWDWQGLVVASSAKEGKQLLQSYLNNEKLTGKFTAKSAADGLSRAEFEEDQMVLKLTKPVDKGVYDTTDYEEVESGKARKLRGRYKEPK